MRSLRSILVTGGAGFVGSSLVRQLLAEPGVERLVVLDRLSTGKRGNLIGPDQDPRFVFVRGDIGNRALVSHLLDLHQVTGLFNLAAVTPGDLAASESPEILATNVSAPNVLLEACRLASVPMLQCSTDQVYGSIEAPGQFTEECPLKPASLYEASKASADLLCLAASATRMQEVVITRSSMNYGPRAQENDLIPALVSRAVRDEEMPLGGKGSHIRSWIHVDDHCHGMIMSFLRGPSGNIFNLGGNCERTNLGIARSILSLFGKSESLLVPGTSEPSGPRRSGVDSGKAIRYFGWTPKVQFQTAFPAVVRELAADLTPAPSTAPNSTPLPDRSLSDRPDPEPSRWAPPRPAENSR